MTVDISDGSAGSGERRGKKGKKKNRDAAVNDDGGTTSSDNKKRNNNNKNQQQQSDGQEDKGVNLVDRRKRVEQEIAQSQRTLFIVLAGVKRHATPLTTP